MTNPVPHVNARYGAPMGRPAQGAGADPMTPFELRRIRINNGGYDDGGAYWGTGQPLYWYCSYETDDVSTRRCLDCNRDARDVLNSDACEHRFAFTINVEVSDFIRADSREHAKEIIKRKYPNATFKR